MISSCYSSAMCLQHDIEGGVRPTTALYDQYSPYIRCPMDILHSITQSLHPAFHLGPCVIILHIVVVMAAHVAACGNKTTTRRPYISIEKTKPTCVSCVFQYQLITLSKNVCAMNSFRFNLKQYKSFFGVFPILYRGEETSTW